MKGVSKMVRVDFTNTEDFQLASEGIQNTTVEKCYEQVSKGKGVQMLVFELRCEDGGKLWHYPGLAKDFVHSDVVVIFREFIPLV